MLKSDNDAMMKPGRNGRSTGPDEGQRGGTNAALIGKNKEIMEANPRVCINPECDWAQSAAETRLQ